MEIEIPVTLTSFEEAEVGELLLLDIDQAKAWGILMEKAGGYKIALLRGGDVPWPVLYTQANSERCGSYGSDWFVELVDDDRSIPFAADRAQQFYGALFVCAGDAPVLRLGPGPGNSPVVTIDLRDCRVRKIEREAIPYFEWRIWRSRDHFEVGDERGLICTVTAAEPQPR
jgi:hypothetical protein